MLSSLKYRKKEIISIGIILLFALVSTYFIYDKFKDARDIAYNSDRLDITFHEKGGDTIDIKKATPMTDSVGLSTQAYKFTIKNNTKKSIKYTIQIEENEEEIEIDDCGEYQIPHNVIKLSIHKQKEKNNIYTLGNLINGTVLQRVIKAGKEEEYTMRFWVTNSSLSTGSRLHYHGKIKVIDEGSQVATIIP